MTDDLSPRMPMHQFASIAEVWHLEDFWHVHLATKLSVMDPTLVTRCAEVSSKMKLPVRFSSSNADVICMVGGVMANPFGPAHLTHGVDKVTRLEYQGFDPSSGMHHETIRRDTGGYAVHWHHEARFDTDKPTAVYTAFSACKRVSWAGATSELKTEIRPGWELLAPAFHENQTVRYYPFRQRMWSMGGDRLERKSVEKPTCITDHDVFERGSMGPTGDLQVIRVMMYRTHNWARSIKQDQLDNDLWPTLVTDYHRVDGPAMVNTYTVKDTVDNSGIKTQVSHDYQHDWYRNGKKVTGTEVQKWASRNGVIMVDHPCHDRPCFPNEMDRAMWALV